MLVDIHCHLHLLHSMTRSLSAFPSRRMVGGADPAYRMPSHGTDLLGQRYAYDLVRTDHRSGFYLHPAGSLRWFLMGDGRGTATAGAAQRMKPSRYGVHGSV